MIIFFKYFFQLFFAQEKKLFVLEQRWFLLFQFLNLLDFVMAQKTFIMNLINLGR